jgi:dihydrodipicolinate synthase/N-acetylneuraminate lyase
VGDYRARIKETLVWLGVLAGAHVRPPLLPVGPEERARLGRLLAEAAPV